MYFHTVRACLFMGGYAAYVWSAVIISVLLLLGLFVISFVKSQQIRRSIQNEYQRNIRVAQARRKESSL